MIEESSGGTSVYYIREPGGELIARVHPTEGIRYYHFDELGSTRLLTDASGSVTDRYAYDAYGSLLAHDRYAGSMDQPYQYVGRLGYYTHYQEPEFRLLQLGVRFCDADAGRFTQRDPMADGPNHFAYAGGNPLMTYDPTGEVCIRVTPCYVSKSTMKNTPWEYNTYTFWYIIPPWVKWSPPTGTFTTVRVTHSWRKMKGRARYYCVEPYMYWNLDACGSGVAQGGVAMRRYYKWASCTSREDRWEGEIVE